MNPIHSYFSKNPILRWLPAFLMMLAIFLFSARPSASTQLDLVQKIIYKAGHVIGYAILTMAYWRASNFQNKKCWLIWLFAILYALTDEYHQSFVHGRHSTLFDVAVYDNAGVLLSLWFASMFTKQKQPPLDEMVVDRTNR